MPNRTDAKRQGKERVEFQAPAKWVRQVEAEAERLQLSVSAFIRQAVSRQVEAEAAKRGGGRRLGDQPAS